MFNRLIRKSQLHTVKVFLSGPLVKLIGLSNMPHCSRTLALVVISIEPVSEPVVRFPAEWSLVLWVSEWTVSDQMIRCFTAMTPLWQWPIWTLGCDVVPKIAAIVTSLKKKGNNNITVYKQVVLLLF